MASSTPAELREFIRSWASDQKLQERLLTENLERFDDLAVPGTAGAASGVMEQIGTHYVGVGQAAVLDGDVSGWQSMRKGCVYKIEGLLLRTRHWQRITDPGRPPFTPLTVAHTTALALALDHPSPEPWFEEVLRRSRHGLWDKARPYALFMRELLRLRRREAIDLEVEELGGYAAIVKAWDDPVALEAALEAVLDIHIEETQDRELPDFGDVEMFAFPAEVLAVIRVREHLELETTPPRHELWDSPLTTTRADGPWPDDDDILRKARTLPGEAHPPRQRVGFLKRVFRKR